MSTELKVEAKDSGRIAIPARILLDTLKTLPEQPLTFKVDEKTFGVEITSETGRYKLSGENAEDFPKIPQPEAVTGNDVFNNPSAFLGTINCAALDAFTSLRFNFTNLCASVETKVIPSGET